MGILLAAEVAERITRQLFPAFLDEAVFRPLKMSRTALGLGRFKIPETMQCQVDHAPGLYGGGAADAKAWHWNSPYWRNLGAPWGGAHSTGPDIGRFLEYFLKLRAGVLKPQTAASMIVNQAGSVDHPWGIGFAVKPGTFGRGCSPKTFGHSGATGTLAWADPENGRVFVLLTTLPADESRKLVINPVSDMISG
jgi:CubicO group peptidase (beta-lactamase class C family)